MSSVWPTADLVMTRREVYLGKTCRIIVVVMGQSRGLSSDFYTGRVRSSDQAR